MIRCQYICCIMMFSDTLFFCIINIISMICIIIFLIIILIFSLGISQWLILYGVSLIFYKPLASSKKILGGNELSRNIITRSSNNYYIGKFIFDYTTMPKKIPKLEYHKKSGIKVEPYLEEMIKNHDVPLLSHSSESHSYNTIRRIADLTDETKLLPYKTRRFELKTTLHWGAT
jgi:hypothetical protein